MIMHKICKCQDICMKSLCTLQVSLPDAMAPRSSHSAVVFGSGADFRIVVLFGGRGAFRGKILSKTTLLTLSELLHS